MSRTGDDARRPSIECAYVALRYVLGQRHPRLLDRLSDPGAEARRLANALSHVDRHQRARVLAADLKPIVEALDKMRLACR
jgi:hypothetical protein